MEVFLLLSFSLDCRISISDFLFQTTNKRGAPCVVKQLKLINDDKALREFQQEAERMKYEQKRKMKNTILSTHRIGTPGT